MVEVFVAQNPNRAQPSSPAQIGMKPRSSRTTATQHPIGSAVVMRAFSGARSLKAFGAYNFAGDVGKVLLPATATSLLLILPWRPAYTLLGLAGIVAAMVIAILTPKVAPEPHPPSADLALGECGEGDTARRFGFRILVLFGITVRVVRATF